MSSYDTELYYYCNSPIALTLPNPPTFRKILKSTELLKSMVNYNINSFSTPEFYENVKVSMLLVTLNLNSSTEYNSTNFFVCIGTFNGTHPTVVHE